MVLRGLTVPDGAEVIQPHFLKDPLVRQHFFQLLLHSRGLLDILASHKLTGQPDAASQRR